MSNRCRLLLSMTNKERNKLSRYQNGRSNLSSNWSDRSSLEAAKKKSNWYNLKPYQNK